MTEYTFPTPVAEAIRNRRPYKSPLHDPFSLAYITKGGTYLIASPPSFTDSGVPRDLLMIMPDNSLIKLSPLTSDTLVHAVKDALGIEWRPCPEVHPRGYGQCTERLGHLEPTGQGAQTRGGTYRHITARGAMFGGDLA